MTKLDRLYEKERDAIEEARRTARKAVGFGAEELEKAMEARLAEARVADTISAGVLRYYQRRLEKEFGDANLAWLRAFRPRHALVREAIEAAHKVGKTDPEAVALHERYIALRASTPRHANSLRRRFGTINLFKAACISMNRRYRKLGAVMEAKEEAADRRAFRAFALKA
jgi:hypothetical protein